MKFYFPQLEIYNPSGLRVYHSHEAAANARILQGLPSSIENLSPEPGSPSLATFLEGVPDFNDKKGEILQRRVPVVVSTVLENCHACSVQEDSWNELERRVNRESMSLLMVKVSPS